MSSSVAAQAWQQTEMPIGIKSQCGKQKPRATVRHLHAHARSVFVAGYSCMVVDASSVRMFSFSSLSSLIVVSLFLPLSAHRGSSDCRFAATSQQPQKFVVVS